MDAFQKSAQESIKNRKPVKIEPPKKTDWVKLINAIYELLKPHIAKMPFYYRLLPFTILGCTGYGVYSLVNLIIEKIQLLWN